MSFVCPNSRKLGHEAGWACGLAVAYCIAWSAALGTADLALGVTGAPLWFEWIAWRLPILFIVSCVLIIGRCFHNYPLDI